MDPRALTRAVGSIFLNRDASTGTRVESSCDIPGCHIARATLHVGDFVGASLTVLRRRWTPTDGCNAGSTAPNPKNLPVFPASCWFPLLSHSRQTTPKSRQT